MKMAFVLSPVGCDRNTGLIFLCLVAFDDRHHSSNNWKHWNISTLEIL